MSTIDIVLKARGQSSSQRTFEKALETLQFPIDTYVNEILKSTTSWATHVGILEGHVDEDESLSPEEEKWSTYFSDHSFKSYEDAKNIADLIQLLTNVNASKFISKRKTSPDRYGIFSWNEWISVVPTSNPNSHDYMLNRAAVRPSFSHYLGSNQFFGSNGGRGNQMTSEIGSFRIPTFDELKSSVLTLLQKNDMFLQDFSDRFSGGDSVPTPVELDEDWDDPEDEGDEDE